jgi:ATP synthase protein I
MAEQLANLACAVSAWCGRPFLDTLGPRPYGAPRSIGPRGVWVFIRAVCAEDVSPMPGPANDRGPGERQMTEAERAAFEGRISDLGDRLDKIKAQRQADADADLDAEMRGRGMAYGMRMAAELVAAVVVGSAIGYGLDRWLGSTPWLFLLFFVLGFVAGVVNVVRSYERVQKDIASRTGGRLGHTVPDDED